MAKQIAVSDDVYQLLMSMKTDGKSFSEVIRELAGPKKNGLWIMKYAGIGKNDSKRLEKLKKLIAEDRMKTFGREFK